MADVTEDARMVPMLPCGDIDEMAAFWTSLGLRTTYRQVRPNPYLALRRNALELHYYGLSHVDPEQSHSTCAIVVPDTASLHALFVTGLRSRYGRVPLTGIPRITRPRQRANNAGLSGFSLIDPAGNWIRVTRPPSDAQQPGSVDDRTEWVSAGGDPLARAVENAVVLADSHGDVAQALRTLTGAVARHAGAPVADRAAAWAYLAELRVRAGDARGAHEASEEVRRLADAPDLSPQDREAIAAAVHEVSELPLEPRR
jgi:catechol 2,3-dioxygenase-like lactoylglutathione lyase family enzyme